MTATDGCHASVAATGMGDATDAMAAVATDVGDMTATDG